MMEEKKKENLFEKIMLEAEAPDENESKEKTYTWVGGVQYKATWNGEKWEIEKLNK